MERMLVSKCLKTSQGPIPALVAPPARGRQTVVLVHRSMAGEECLDGLVDRLAQTCRVVVPELPGFGSETDHHALDLDALTRQLEAALDALRQSSVVLIGSGLGGPVAAELAIRAPERVRSLVLMGMTVNPEHRSMAPQLTRWILQGQRHDRDAAQAQEDSAVALRRLRETFRFGGRDRIEGRLTRIPCPTLILCGDHDPLSPAEWALEAAELVPHGKLGVVHTRDSFRMDGSFEECARHILRFL